MSSKHKHDWDAIEEMLCEAQESLRDAAEKIGAVYRELSDTELAARIKRYVLSGVEVLIDDNHEWLGKHVSIADVIVECVDLRNEEEEALDPADAEADARAGAGDQKAKELKENGR